jgi:hypothetical protein
MTVQKTKTDINDIDKQVEDKKPFELLDDEGLAVETCVMSEARVKLMYDLHEAKDTEWKKLRHLLDEQLIVEKGPRRFERGNRRRTGGGEKDAGLTQ